MPTYGLTPTGFVIKPLAIILAEIEAYQLSEISPQLNLQATAIMGQVNGIVSEKLAEVWEALQAVNASTDPDHATDNALDVVAKLTGAQRLPATKSTVTLTCTGTPTTVLPVGRVVSVDTAGDRFVSLAEATIGGGGTVSAEFEAEEYGPVVANAATLTEIETPVSGWTSVTNAEDADTGRAIESDEALRQRRIDLLGASGDATIDAIRAEVLAVADVTECRVFKNDTDTTDGDGLPPHSVEVVVRGGDSTAIINAIFNSVAAGIQTFGDNSGQVVDSQGVSHTVKFSDPDEIALEVVVWIERDVDDGFDDTATVAAIKTSLATYVDTFLIGQDAIVSRFFDPCFRDYVQATHPEFAGILDVTTITFGGGSPNVTASSREVITLDTADIDIGLTP